MSLRRELDIFFVALTFLSRLPAPRWARFEEDYMQLASRYYPLVGALLGLLCWLSYSLAATVFEHPIAVIISMIAGLLLTGCFHEDGFADFCDGFGGGWTAEQTLNIMKDSRLGTYGAAGLLSVLGLKASLLFAMPIEAMLAAMLLSHTVSRFVAVSLLLNYPYAQLDQLSKVKPLATQLQGKDFAFATATAIAGLLIALPWFSPLELAGLCATLWIVRGLFGRYLVKRIGGYTGDCLGALQQISELICLMSLVAVIG